MHSQVQNFDLSAQHIIQAFKVIGNPSNSPQAIAAANQYLLKCEQNSQFPSILLKLYAKSPEQFIQLQSLLLLLNLIKRNWQTKRGRLKNEETQNFQKQKVFLRKEILAAYSLYHLKNVKHFNQIFKFLARQDYPIKFPELHSFMIDSLKNLVYVVDSKAIFQQSVIVVGVLSTVKIVIKEYASRRLSHNEETFNTYISELIKLAIPLSRQLHNIIQSFDYGQNQSQKNIHVLLESAKKVDKTLMYCLQSMPSSLQYVKDVQQIFRRTILQISKYDQLLKNKSNNLGDLKTNFESYLCGVLQQAAKTQSLYPFLLSWNLNEYLHMLLTMLLQNVPGRIYSNDRLVVAIVESNLKIFTTFVYYMTPQEFAGSIYNRNKSVSNSQLQKQCHDQFIQVFTQENVIQMLEKLLSDVMVCKTVNPKSQKQLIDQQMVLEENEVAMRDTLSQTTAYEACILLCKNLVKCFKKQVKPLLNSLFLSIGQQDNTQQKRKIAENSMQLILVLPKVFDEHQLPIENVTQLLQALYSKRQFSMLARLIKNYQEYLNQTTLENSFSVLSKIVGTPLYDPNVNLDIIYQAALTMKKILSQNDSETFGSCMQDVSYSKCMVNLLSLLQNEQFTRNPTLMWPLIKLSNQLIKLTEPQIILQQVGSQVLDCLYPLLQARNQEELTVCGVGEALENMLNIVCSVFKSTFLDEQALQKSPQLNPQTLFKAFYSAYYLLTLNIDNQQLQSVDNLYRLWLCLMRNYPTLSQQQIFHLESYKQMQDLNSQLRNLFSQVFDNVLQQDPVCAVQLLEEYIICGLIQLDENQLSKVFQGILGQCLEEHKVRAYIALFSMYFCQLIGSTEDGFSKLFKNVLRLLAQTLHKYQSQISPQINGLRTIVMIIINYSIIKFGAPAIYQLLSSFYQGNYAAWFLAYSWNSQYVSNRLCHKINATAYLKAIEQIGPANFGQMLKTPIEGQYPLDVILKTMVLSLQPIRLSQCYNTLSNMYKLILPTQTTAISLESTVSRKVRLQLSGLIREVLLSDQRDFYRQCINQVFKSWDWGEDDVIQRFDKGTSQEIISLLKGQYKKDYDLNSPD